MLLTSHTNFNFLKVRPFVLDVTGVGTLLPSGFECWGHGTVSTTTHPLQESRERGAGIHPGVVSLTGRVLDLNPTFDSSLMFRT